MFNFAGPELLREVTTKSFFNFCQKRIKEGDVVLEIGPGDGSLAELITKTKKVDYKMFDISDQRKKARNLKFEKIDVSWNVFPLPDNTLDVILVSQVLEHLENFSHFFRESYRVLKKEGYLIIKLPNFNSFFQKMLFLKNGVPSRLSGKLNEGGHINFLTPPFLKILIL